MKSLGYKLLVLLFLVTVVSVLGASAQVWNTFSFTSPNAFIVEKTTLPPGTYTVRPFQDDPDLLELLGSTGHSVIFTCEASDATGQKAELTFHRYADGLYLKQVSIAGSACSVPAGPLEKKSKKSGKPTKETVAVSTK